MDVFTHVILPLLGD